MRQVLNHIYNAQMAHSCSNFDKLRIELESAAKLVEEKFTSTNSAMDAIADRYINEVEYLDSQDTGVVRSFVAYLQQQHQ